MGGEIRHVSIDRGPGICPCLGLCSTVVPAAREKPELETKATAAGWRSLSLSCSMSSSFHPTLHLPDLLFCLPLLSPLCCGLCSLPPPAKGCSPPREGLATACRVSPVPVRADSLGRSQLPSPSPLEVTRSYVFLSESPSCGLNPVGMGEPRPHWWKSCPLVTEAHLW